MTELSFRDASIAKANRRNRNMWGHETGPHVVRPPLPHEVLFQSRNVKQCLTHLTRHITDVYWVSRDWEWGIHANRVNEGWCGITMNRPILVPVADESFVCARCIKAAEHRGEPTFSMIPNTGCEVTGGKRWRPR